MLQMLDTARDHGVNFIDTRRNLSHSAPAMNGYIVLRKSLASGCSSKIVVGVIVASKVVGPAHGWFDPPVRGGTAALDRHHIRQAVEGVSNVCAPTTSICIRFTGWIMIMVMNACLRTDRITAGGEDSGGGFPMKAHGVMKANQVAEQLGTVRLNPCKIIFPSITVAGRCAGGYLPPRADQSVALFAAGRGCFER